MHLRGNAEDLKRATHVLRELAFKLKGHIPRTRLRWLVSLYAESAAAEARY
jgi:hypothetical protein